jgi:hypothetical protein
MVPMRERWELLPSISAALIVENVRPTLIGAAVTSIGPVDTGRVKWAVTLTGSRPSAASDIARAAIDIR